MQILFLFDLSFHHRHHHRNYRIRLTVLAKREGIEEKKQERIASNQPDQI